MYVSYKQSPAIGTALVMRGAMDPNRLVSAIQRAVWELNKNQALDDIKTLEQIKSESLGGNRLRTALLGVDPILQARTPRLGTSGSSRERTSETGQAIPPVSEAVHGRHGAHDCSGKWGVYTGPHQEVRHRPVSKQDRGWSSKRPQEALEGRIQLTKKEHYHGKM